MKRNLEIGDKVPVFKLKDHNSNIFDLSDVLYKKNLIIYFYPKDGTSGCTAQACSFRDAYEDFLEHDCEIIGISSDSERSHTGFVAQHRLPFTLLSDTDGFTQKLYGVKRNLLGLLPGRVTFVVNKAGKIIYKFNSQIKIQDHIQKSLDALKKQA